jgi:hypothetical protein
MTLPCMEALELRYIALGYKHFQLVSFDIQNDFIVHGGIFSTSWSFGLEVHCARSFL